MKFSHKLIAGYMVVAFITAGTGIIGIMTAAKIKDRYEQLALGGLPIHQALDQLKFAGLRVVSSTSEAIFLIGEEERVRSEHQTIESKEISEDLLEELKLIEHGKSLFYGAVAEYKRVVEIYDPPAVEHVGTIEKLGTELLESGFNLLVAKRSGESPAIIAETGERFEDAENAYLDYIDPIIANRENLLNTKLKTDIKHYGRSSFLIIILGIMALIAAFTFGVLQAKGIASNLSKLIRKAELVGAGDLDQIVELDTNDELADLAATFNKMAADLKKSDLGKRKAQQGLQLHAAQLENNTRELQEIVFAASHDLQEPMRKIMTFSERLIQEHDAGTSSKAVEYLHKMTVAAGNMRFLLDDLMAYSQLISREVSLENADLRRLIEKAILQLREKFPEQETDFAYNSTLSAVTCDRKLLQMVFYNLFENSVKFCQQGVKPLVEIDVDAAEGYCSITVQDNSKGFQQKFADRIFSIFEQLDSQNEGNGIGLAMCRKIMEKHDGDISAESKEEAGVKFTITLPIVTTPKQTGA